MTEVEFRELRHAILMQSRNTCHYCQSRAHQIAQTCESTWVPVCRRCQRTINTHHFANETAKHTALSSEHHP